MRHLALILLTGSFFTACLTDTDKALWSETKDTISTGKFASLDAQTTAPATVAEDDKLEKQENPEAKDAEAIEAPKQDRATTGR